MKNRLLILCLVLLVLCGCSAHAPQEWQKMAIIAETEECFGALNDGNKEYFAQFLADEIDESVLFLKLQNGEYISLSKRLINGKKSQWPWRTNCDKLQDLWINPQTVRLTD